MVVPCGRAASSCTHVDPCPPHARPMFSLTESDRRGEASSSCNLQEECRPNTGVSNARSKGELTNALEHHLQLAAASLRKVRSAHRSMMPTCTSESNPAVAKQRNSTNPDRVPACNRRHSNSCMPSASFLPASVDANRHPVNMRPRTPVSDFAPRGPACRRSDHVCVPEVTGVGDHDGNSHCLFLTQTPWLPLANRKRPRRQDGTMTSAAIWRVCSDVGIHWRENK